MQPLHRFTTIFLGAALVAATAARADDGRLPADAQGRPLNLDFEAGSLKDWTAEGAAFGCQPVEGDAVHARRGDMRSGHQGKYWVGTFEVGGDAPRGTLTSVPFRVTSPFASFLVGGGRSEETRVEVVRKDSGQVVFRASGEDVEDLRRVAVDLRPHLGREVFIRVVDAASGGWGHVNFDDFRLHETKPDVPERPNSTPGRFAHAGLSPEEAARAMTVPAGFHVSLFAGEPDVVQPIAMAVDDRGRLWVAEAYSYPKRVPDAQAKDRILIFEDTNNDGHFDVRKVFAEKLNLVSGLEVGFGGVWVGAAPEFLFIPDADGDDKPDGPPRVLLDGWGQHDTHETLNSFNWGPDGWLYGCHGVFTHSLVGKPGTPADKRTPLNAGIWRYHPTRHVFEVFAQGTSNPWGVDFNDMGQAFLTSCVIPHLYHVIQGGRYERQAGQHFNLYTYDDIKTIADHRHYVGDIREHAWWGHAPIPAEQTLAAGGGHAHAGALIYLGGAWPEPYRDSIFMNNIHGARINRDILKPKGSGFVGSHAPDFLLANDGWSQIISLRTGPDGNVFMIDWYDKNQCHRVEDVHDRTNGRIFKVSFGNPPRGRFAVESRNGVAHRSLLDLGDIELADQLSKPNDWYARHARRILQERASKPGSKPLAGLRDGLAGWAFGHPDESYRLRSLWALHAYGGLDEGHVAKGLADPGVYVRAWTIQLATEAGEPSSATLAKFAELAKSDRSPVVRLYLASALQRLPASKRWDVLAGLLGHGEDGDDPNLPLMDWYAAEPLAEADPARAASLARGPRIPLIQAFMARRLTALGTPEALALVVGELGRAEGSAERRRLLQGINEALRGRRTVAMPEGWPAVAERLAKDEDPQVRSQGVALGLNFGDAGAMAAMRRVLADAAAGLDRRREALAALRKVRDPQLAPALHRLLAEPSLRGEALRALASYDDPKTPTLILDAFPRLTPAERRDALNTLAARVESARALLAAVAGGRVARSDLSADLVRQLRNLKDKSIDEQIAKVWGAVRETKADAARRIARYKALLTDPGAPPPDPMLGRAVFAKTCAQCHKLFGAGGDVGPELTGSNRADLDYLLSNVLDPSALIGKDYLAHVVATADGRILTGIIRAEDKDAITLVTANETFIIPRVDIDESKPSDTSMMPEDLWTPLSDGEVRSLVAYLAGPGQVPMLATADNVGGFFNGKDLAGWSGDPKLWRVEGGEIVGKTSGLARNTFLRSDLAAADFRLTLRAKLVDDAGNSGVQFRSMPLPDGEMKGDQADIGPGWWGKLYEENGRGLLWDRSGEAHVKPGEWNTYEIVAKGPRIRTFLNGKPCVDLDDPAGARRGIFALQLHSGGPTEVRFKDIKLELDPK
ncbi:MAG TPA: PVC-type heme-binding CxxCH protein [Isosphaeraceae bacterium]|jgi:putative membrane-bound dehydrogenase-like protein|nr:PVC-type heme-binding CxxCH protein [Isosphaeraceae bacterium]